MKQLISDILIAVFVAALLSLLAGVLISVASGIFYLVFGHSMDFQVNYMVSIADIGIWISSLATSLL